MSRMSGPARREWCEFLAARDGARCFVGGESGNANSLIVDHWDGDDANNRPGNLHLLCRQMNAVKNPRGRAVSRKHPTKDDLLSSMHVRRVEGEEAVISMVRKAQSSELIKNLGHEPNFRHWVFYCIVHATELELDKVVINGAALVGCSDDTIKRYVKRLTCIAGLYQLKASDKMGVQVIRLKPRWENFRRRNAENARLSEQSRNWREADAEGLGQGMVLRVGSFGREADAT